MKSSALDNNRKGKKVFHNMPNRHRGEVQVQLNLYSAAALKGDGLVSAMSQPLCLWEGDVVSILLQAGWALGPVWLGLENFAPTRVVNPRTCTPQQFAILAVFSQSLITTADRFKYVYVNILQNGSLLTGCKII